MTGEQRVILGRVGAIFGVRGWIKLWSFTDPIENLLEYREFELGQEGHWRRGRLAEGRKHGKGLIARFEGVDDRDSAAALVGAELAVARSQLPAPAEGEYYWADLVGLEVVNREGIRLGTVEQMVATGANDVMLVKGERERMLPFLPGRFVDQVDLDGGRIVVDWDPEF